MAKRAKDIKAELDQIEEDIKRYLVTNGTSTLKIEDFEEYQGNPNKYTKINERLVAWNRAIVFEEVGLRRLVANYIKVYKQLSR